jgi:hypothetical protein
MGELQGSFPQATCLFYLIQHLNSWNLTPVRINVSQGRRKHFPVDQTTCHIRQVSCRRANHFGSLGEHVLTTYM